jgi:hypothetical protein
LKRTTNDAWSTDLKIEMKKLSKAGKESLEEYGKSSKLQHAVTENIHKTFRKKE